ncbi:MAG: aminotransferase class I/II-fold pyridoxal phosphate-dependent enzyme [Cyanobacteriota bacterium]|nr:aminotransferase class I/II-fold pyridoxal phosphate-dependent enzyme [Cyanobacteriota bacterium]
MSFSADSSQKRLPLLERLRSRAAQPDAAFYAPGHKRGQGIPDALAHLLGPSVFPADLPELPELDNLFAPQGVIAEAQNLAAEAFGAQRTWFLANGSTSGIIAAILATCNSGDKIILPRNSHQSAIAGLILSGAIPIFIPPQYDPAIDLVLSVTPEAVEQALKQNSDAKAVMVVYPTYHGICCDLAAIAQLAHRHNIPLLADEAHGAHFAFHRDLPDSAIAAGADISVQSTHKLLGAMTQASMLHLQGDRIDPQRLALSLQLVQSTSPSYLLLASLDAARQQVALQGEALMSRTLELSDRASAEIAQIPGLSVLQTPPHLQPGFADRDRTRLVVFTSQLGLTGFEVDEILSQQLGVTAELPMLHHIAFIITLGNTAADIEKLIQGFQKLAQTPRHPLSPSPPLPVTPSPRHPLSPREAFFAATETLPLEETAGRISAELVCPYPPGIPLLLPGEAIARSALNDLQQILASGGIVSGCSDPSLKTLKIIKHQA